MTQGAGPKAGSPASPPLFGPQGLSEAKSGPVSDPEADRQAARWRTRDGSMTSQSLEGTVLKEVVGYYKSRRQSPWSYVLSLKKGLNKENLVKALVSGRVLL
jgi:hypothetical protein